VITPSFNQGAFIQATIDSVLGQDFYGVELIVMDGGSTDHTVPVLEAVKDPRFRFLSEPDRGQSHAINKGVALAHGEFITYLNSDDTLASEAVGEAVAYFDAHPNIALLYADGHYLAPDGRPIHSYKSDDHDIRRLVRLAQAWAQPGTFWRRSVSETIGGFDERLSYRMDTDFWIRAALAGFQPKHLSCNWGGYRLHNESKTVSMAAHFLNDSTQILDKVFSHPDLPIELQQLEQTARSWIAWGETKHLWLVHDYAAARPRLRRHLHDPGKSRRALALLMLLDSSLDTRFSVKLAHFFTRWTGKPIFYDQIANLLK
jgi:glycosyltransferase involved in cell wall biosynthesis